MLTLWILAGTSLVAFLLIASFDLRGKRAEAERVIANRFIEPNLPILSVRWTPIFCGVSVMFAFSALPMVAQAPTMGTAVSLPTDAASVSSFLQTHSFRDVSGSTFSSSLDGESALTPDLATGVGGETQPPPRRRYGRARYSDSHHNADGSNKYTFLLGAGMTIPSGTTHNDLTPSFNFQGGFGRNFNQKFGVIGQFDWANFGIQTGTLNNLLAIYNSIGAVDQNGQPLTQLGGSSHAWSLTVNPTYNIVQGDSTGIYVVGGVGFYHKTANFTIPGVGTYCDPYYGCYQYQANQSIDKYTSNAAGVNGGVGFTYKLSRFSAGRLYVEARYVFVANQPRPYSIGSATSNYFNVFPQNSARTTFLPITVGFRF